MSNCKEDTEDGENEKQVIEGVPQIKSFRLLGDSPEGLVEKSQFKGSDTIILELTAYSLNKNIDKLEICKIISTMPPIEYPTPHIKDLPEQTESMQTYNINIYPEILSSSGDYILEFLVIDNKNNKSNKIATTLKISALL